VEEKPTENPVENVTPKENLEESGRDFHASLDVRAAGSGGQDATPADTENAGSRASVESGDDATGKTRLSKGKGPAESASSSGVSAESDEEDAMKRPDEEVESVKYYRFSGGMEFECEESDALCKRITYKPGSMYTSEVNYLGSRKDIDDGAAGSESPEDVHAQYWSPLIGDCYDLAVSSVKDIDDGAAGSESPEDVHAQYWSPLNLGDCYNLAVVIGVGIAGVALHYYYYEGHSEL
jgi:hypothetical protein